MPLILSRRRKAQFTAVAVAWAMEELRRDDDESAVRRRSERTSYVRPVNMLRPIRGEYETLVADIRELDDKSWKREYFRMSDESFAELLRLVGPSIEKRDTHLLPISAGARLAFTVKALASGCSLKDVHKPYRWGYSTAVTIFHETCEAIWTALRDQYMSIPDADRWKAIADGFRDRWNFPGCLGAVDGKHVIIQKPARAGSQYYNYKKDHSIVLMAVVDANYNFTYIDVGAYGREGDSGVFSRSRLCKAIYHPSNPLSLPGQFRLPGSELISNHLFVGDEAFAGSHRLVHPYAGNKSALSIGHRIFNYRLSRARRIVENAFGVLSSRWRIFRRPILYEPRRVVALVKAACVLHNFIRARGADQDYMPQRFVDGDDEDGGWRRLPLPRSVFEDMNNNESSPAEKYRHGCALRDTLKEYFMSEAGAVPWQRDMV